MVSKMTEQRPHKADQEADEPSIAEEVDIEAQAPRRAAWGPLVRRRASSRSSVDFDRTHLGTEPT